MTIRTRLNLWYSAILCAVALAVVVAALYHELVLEPRHHRQIVKGGLERHQAGEPEIDSGDLVDILMWTVTPAVVLGLTGGWWLTRRALAPMTELTGAVEKIHEKNLGEKIQRSGNGDELDRLTEVFNDMTARLDDSFSRIREFTLHASHELKTPLTVMCGEAEIASRDESLPSTERERAASQLDELRRLARIVDGLTLLAKADAGQVVLKPEPLRLDDLVHEAFADAQILAEPQGVQVELAACEEITVRGDRHRLRQLLLNLADNAVKYNQPKGGVIMSLVKSFDMAQFTITNTGAGISPEKLPRVFDRFFRGDPAHENTIDGCGLGLSIAQWIVSAHGGKIQIESEPSKLTTVTVRLPTAK